MHVTTHLPNFAPPHFTARGISKNTPHGTMEGHTAYIYTRAVFSTSDRASKEVRNTREPALRVA